MIGISRDIQGITSDGYQTLDFFANGPEDESTAAGLYFYNGENTKSLNISVGIPNGFIQLGDSDILIADSYTKRVNLFRMDRVNEILQFKRCWHDFSVEDFTPDGGCAGKSGNVYIALWDGFGIAVLNYAGDLLRVLEIPVPRPTNCKLACDGKLYVTSATEGLSVEQLRMYPLSGSILAVDLD